MIQVGPSPRTRQQLDFGCPNSARKAPVPIQIAGRLEPSLVVPFFLPVFSVLPNVVLGSPNKRVIEISCRLFRVHLREFLGLLFVVQVPWRRQAAQAVLV